MNKKTRLPEVAALIAADIKRRPLSNKERAKQIAKIVGWEPTSILLMLENDLWQDEIDEETILVEDDYPEEFSPDPLFVDDEREDYTFDTEREDGDPQELNFHDERRW